MAFPALAKLNTAALTAQASGIPDDGVNVISVALDLTGVPASVLDDNFITVQLEPDASAPGVTAYSYVSRASDLSTLTLNITQKAPGYGRCRIRVTVINTDTR